MHPASSLVFFVFFIRGKLLKVRKIDYRFGRKIVKAHFFFTDDLASNAYEENDPRRRPKPSGRPPKPSRKGKIFVVFTLNPWTLMSKRSFTAKVCT